MSPEEKEFLEKYDDDKYKKVSITADVLTFTIDTNEKNGYGLQVLLLERKTYPFKDMWSIPGGFLKIDETLNEAAKRVSKEKTNLDLSYLEQLYTFSDVERDPRTRIISTTYLNLVHKKDCFLDAGCKWFDLKVEEEKLKTGGYKFKITAEKDGVSLNAVCDVEINNSTNRLEKTNYKFNVLSSDFAFDHAKMICMGYMRLKSKIEYSNIAFHFVDEKFTLPSLQKVYECILNKKFNKTPFRNKVSKYIEKTQIKEMVKGFSKPATFYRYKGEESYDFN